MFEFLFTKGVRAVAGLPPALGAAAAIAWLGAAPAHAANTDVYLDWAIPAEAGWYWANYVDYANRGNTNAVGDFSLLEYQTKTGLTGTSRDSFEFWTGADIGYANPLGTKTNSSGFGVAAPNIGAEWYYYLIPSSEKFGSPNYRVLTISPWVEINAPNGNTTSGGFGAGANQWSYEAVLLGTYRSGRFTTTVQPVTLTYASTDLNTTSIANPDGTASLTRLRGGLSASFGAFNVGYDVAPTWTVGIYQAWNAYSIAGARYSPKQYEGTVGPMVSYSGLSSIGLTLDASVQADYYHSRGMPEGLFVTTYLSRHF